MKNSPVFTFVVPVFGTEAFLRRCLDSIVAQTDPDFEVVVVDDCSPGNCREIVAQYDSRFRYVRHDKNRSLLQARWTGAKEARGEYLIAVDSDDYIAEGLIGELRKEIAEGGESDIIVYQTVIDNDGRFETFPYNHSSKRRCSCQEAMIGIFQGQSLWNVCGKAIKRTSCLNALSQLGITDDFYRNMAEDLCQMLAIYLTASSVSYIEYLGYFYVRNPSSLTRSVDSFKKVAEKAKNDKSSLEMVVEFAKRLQCDEVIINGLNSIYGKLVGWMLPDASWSTVAERTSIINMLCRTFGAKFVLPECLARYYDFTIWYSPSVQALKQVGSRKIQNIAVLCCTYRGGGAERANWLWMNAMLKSGKRIVWIYDECREREVKEIVLPEGMLTISLTTENRAKRALDLANILQDNSIDAVLLVDHWRPLVIDDLLIAKSLERTVVVAEHNAYLFPLDDINPTLYCQRANFYPLADLITVLSPENVAWWAAAGIDQTVYMPNLLTFDPNLVSSEDVSQGKAPHEFLFVGRICVRKNTSAVLEAFKLFREAHPEYADSKLNILGRYEGDRDREIVEAAIRRWRLEGSVTILGEVSDVASYYRRATALLMASRIEGAPMVIMEAKSYGVPTVMFDLPYVVGTSEKEGVVSVRQGDTQAMADAMYGLVSDPDRYRALSQAARDSLSEYDEKSILARWDRVFEMLESGAAIDHLCEDVDSGRMLKMTMQGLGLIAPVFAGWWRDQVNRAWNASRLLDECRAELEHCRQIGQGSRNSELYWIAEAERLRNSRAYKIGRAITWPYRMMRSTCRSLRSEGIVTTWKRVPRKIRNLKRRFFPSTT